MSHPIVRTDSLRPGYIRGPRTSLVTVVTGHRGYDKSEKEVGWKLVRLYLHECYNKKIYIKKKHTKKFTSTAIRHEAC